ncbi:MAG: hypothetical protein QM698_09585 [Micropepsaceae bacterium]
MTHWYTADPHFRHESIIADARRLFRDTNHVDSVMIERLWETVGPEDDLWVIGDFAFAPKAKDEDWLLTIFGQLPGAPRHLIISNHDGEQTQALPWDSVSWLAEVNDPTGEKLVTPCHYPMITWNTPARAPCTCSAMSTATGRAARTRSMSGWMSGLSTR